MTTSLGQKLRESHTRLRRRCLPLALVLACGCLAWPGLAAETNRPVFKPTFHSMDRLDNRQRLGPGDRVVYRVIEDQDEPKSITITDSGDLEVPYLGLVRAADKTSWQLAREIKTLLEKEHYYQATVIIAVEVINKTRVTGKFYVAGQVRNTGGFDIPAGEAITVSKAIITAGGFTEFADKKSVRLVRNNAGERTTYVLNIVEIWEKGKNDIDMIVQPGDMVVVPARLW